MSIVRVPFKLEIKHYIGIVIGTQCSQPRHSSPHVNIVFKFLNAVTESWDGGIGLLSVLFLKVNTFYPATATKIYG